MTSVEQIFIPEGGEEVRLKLSDDAKQPSNNTFIVE